MKLHAYLHLLAQTHSHVKSSRHKFQIEILYYVCCCQVEAKMISLRVSREFYPTSLKNLFFVFLPYSLIGKCAAVLIRGTQLSLVGEDEACQVGWWWRCVESGREAHTCWTCSAWRADRLIRKYVPLRIPWTQFLASPPEYKVCDCESWLCVVSTGLGLHPTLVATVLKYESARPFFLPSLPPFFPPTLCIFCDPWSLSLPSILLPAWQPLLPPSFAPEFPP